jgi:hypothetical protein
MRFLITLSLVLVFCSAHAESKLSLPLGWRNAQGKEITPSGDNWRTANTSLYQRVSGDFDRDGKVDEARLLVDNSGQRFALFVFFGRGDWLIFEDGDIERLPYLGIEHIKPGAYKTACGKGYWACESEEPARLLLKADGISFLRMRVQSPFSSGIKTQSSFVRYG